MAILILSAARLFRLNPDHDPTLGKIDPKYSDELKKTWKCRVCRVNENINPAYCPPVKLFHKMELSRGKKAISIARILVVGLYEPFISQQSAQLWFYYVYLSSPHDYDRTMNIKEQSTRLWCNYEYIKAAYMTMMQLWIYKSSLHDYDATMNICQQSTRLWCNN